MKKRKNQIYNDPWDRDYYETGSTRPPKTHGKLIAFLLICVIVLGCTCTGMGLMNIHLFRIVAKQEQENHTKKDSIQPYLNANSGESAAVSVPVQTDDGQNPVQLGVQCVSVSAFDRRYYSLPSGCLLLEVTQNSCADKAGLVSGDVIIAFNDVATENTDLLIALLQDCAAGDRVELTVYKYRNQSYETIAVTLDEWSDPE